MDENSFPKWWNPEHESRWQRVRAEFMHNLDRRKHVYNTPETGAALEVENAVKQAKAWQSVSPRGQRIDEATENAYRFGYSARTQYRSQHAVWDDRLEAARMHEGVFTV